VVFDCQAKGLKQDFFMVGYAREK